MTNRYEEAIACQDAVNPSGVAHTWLDSYQDFHKSPAYTGTESVKRDPALRLIAYKLADLMGCPVEDADVPGRMAAAPPTALACYTRAYEACKRMAHEEAPAKRQAESNDGVVG